MHIIYSFLIATVVAMFSAPASAQSRDSLGFTPYGSYGSFQQRLQDSRSRESVSDILNRQQSDMRRREEQDRLQNQIRDLEFKNSRLRAFRAQERDRHRRYDPASGIWSPARSQ